MKKRPSDEEIEKRILIGVKLIKAYNFKIGKQQFRKEYKEALNENKLDVPTDSRTITKYKEKIEKRILEDYDRDIAWESHFVEMPKANSIFSELGNDISSKIRKVFLCTAGMEYVLYRNNINFQTMEEFKKPVKKLYSMRKDKNNITVNNNSLIQIYIVFKEEGYEEETADFFNQNGNLEKILFTDAKHYCTEIVSELRYLKTLMEDLYFTIFP